MENAKHLPAPWTVLVNDKGTVYIKAPDETDPGWPWTVATVDNSAFYAGSQPDNTMANARLIAAAPELLEALEKISRCQADGIAPDDPGGWMDFFIETARAAIAKATNQTA